MSTVTRIFPLSTIVSIEDPTIEKWVLEEYENYGQTSDKGESIPDFYLIAACVALRVEEHHLEDVASHLLHTGEWVEFGYGQVHHFWEAAVSQEIKDERFFCDISRGEIDSIVWNVVFKFQLFHEKEDEFYAIPVVGVW